MLFLLVVDDEEEDKDEEGGIGSGCSCLFKAAASAADGLLSQSL